MRTRNPGSRVGIGVGRVAFLPALALLLGGTVFAGLPQKKGRELSLDPRAVTVGNIKQVGLALLMYATDYDDVYPWAQNTLTVKGVTYPYVMNRSVWRTHNPSGGEFLFNLSIGGVEFSTIPRPAKTVAFHESKPWPDSKRCVGYADGSARVVDAPTWASDSKSLLLKLKRKAKRPLPANWGKQFLPPGG